MDLKTIALLNVPISFFNLIRCGKNAKGNFYKIIFDYLKALDKVIFNYVFDEVILYKVIGLLNCIFYYVSFDEVTHWQTKSCHKRKEFSVN